MNAGKTNAGTLLSEAGAILWLAVQIGDRKVKGDKGLVLEKVHKFNHRESKELSTGESCHPARPLKLNYSLWFRKVFICFSDQVRNE